MIKKIFLFLLIPLLLGIVFLARSSPARAISWSKFDGNPVLDVGPVGSWDGARVSAPAVIFDGTIYKMWYGGLDGSRYKIGYATSPDGKSWTKYEGNPVLGTNPNIPHEKSVTEPAVVFNGINYEMWYTSSPDTGSDFRIGYATSSNGINWTHHSSLVLFPTESWEIQGVATPFVIKHGETYKMWYAARDNHGVWRIGYATSPNGIDWSKYINNPVLTATESWEGSVVVRPSVVMNDSMYLVWYHAGYPDGPMLPLVIDFAYSNNGVSWIKPADENPVIKRGLGGSFDDTYITAPSVVKRGDVYQMWYAGCHLSSDLLICKIGYASTGEIPPPPPEKQPIVLLPGFGASWNFKKIFLGQEVPQSEWKMASFVKHYDNLIATLETADYTQGKDLFVFNYDWTKPVDQIADDLKEYIDETVDPPKGESSGKKVKLIGHSLGGLAARTYIQKNETTHQADQLITIGSPHKGVVQAYKVWEGADFHDLLSEPLRLGGELLLALRGRDYKNKVEAVRDIIPGLKDLLFIDDYLKQHPSGKITPESSLSQQNLWLKNLAITDEVKSVLNTIAGRIGDTLRWVKVVRPSKIDKMMGRFEDGKPVGEEFETGDKIVLASSAGPEGTNTTEVFLDHSDLVRTQEGIEIILSLLKMEGISAVANPYPPDTPFLVFALASPGNLRITNPLGEMAGFDISPPTIPDAHFLAEERMVIIPGAIDGNYKAEVVGNGETGSYRLLVGQLTEKGDIWTEYQGETAPSKTDTYSINVDNTLNTTPLDLAHLIKSKLKKLFIKATIEPLHLRKKIKIVGQITKILGEFEPTIALLELKRNQAAQKLIEKTLLDSLNLVASLEKNGLISLLELLRDMIDHLDQLHQLLSH